MRALGGLHADQAGNPLLPHQRPRSPRSPSNEGHGHGWRESRAHLPHSCFTSPLQGNNTHALVSRYSTYAPVPATRPDTDASGVLSKPQRLLRSRKPDAQGGSPVQLGQTECLTGVHLTIWVLPLLCSLDFSTQVLCLSPLAMGWGWGWGPYLSEYTPGGEHMANSGHFAYPSFSKTGI